jgi:primosomal protein N'
MISPSSRIPTRRSDNLIFQAENMAVAAREARRVASSLGRPALEGVRILGPGFAARSKVAGRYRCQVLVKVPRQKHRAIRERLRALIQDPAMGRVMTVDVDPMTVH